MNVIHVVIKLYISNFFSETYNIVLENQDITLCFTPKGIDGDITVLCFKLSKRVGIPSLELGTLIGKYLLQANNNMCQAYNVKQGFLNIKIQPKIWLGFIVNFEPVLTRNFFNNYRVTDDNMNLLECYKPLVKTINRKALPRLNSSLPIANVYNSVYENALLKLYRKSQYYIVNDNEKVIDINNNDILNSIIKYTDERVRELKKDTSLTEKEFETLVYTIAVNILKYSVLKVNLGNLKEFKLENLLKFKGDSAVYLLYTYARIQSMVSGLNIDIPSNISIKTTISNKETELMKLLYKYMSLIPNAANYNKPQLVANYIYSLAKTYNHFYCNYPILKESNWNLRDLRIVISYKVALTIKEGLIILGISTINKM